MGNELGKLFITIGANNKAYKKSLEDTNASTQKFSKNMSAQFGKIGLAMTAMGVSMLVAMGKMVSSYAKAGDEVAKMAKRTGIGTEALSEMRYVAQICGTELGSIEKAVKRMSRSIVDADRGLETYARSFRELGLDITALKNMKPEDAFWIIADAIGGVENELTRAALAQEIFGRAGTDLLPMLGESTEAIDGLKQKAHDLNLVFDEEHAAAAEAYVDAMTDMKGALDGLKNALAESVMPTITEFINQITDKLIPVIGWLKDHPEVGQAFLKFGLVFVVGGALFLAIAGFIKLLGFLTAALITMQAFMGPAGWTALGVGAATALGVLTAQNLGAFGWGGEGEEVKAKQQQEPPAGYASWDVYYAATGAYQRAGGGPIGEWWSEEQRTAYREQHIPTFHTGGIVPGPIGQPRLVEALGGEVFLGVGSSRGGGNVYVTVQGSVIAERDLAETLRTELVKIKNRNTTTGL